MKAPACNLVIKSLLNRYSVARRWLLYRWLIAHPSYMIPKAVLIMIILRNSEFLLGAVFFACATKVLYTIRTVISHLQP